MPDNGKMGALDEGERESLYRRAIFLLTGAAAPSPNQQQQDQQKQNEQQQKQNEQQQKQNAEQQKQNEAQQKQNAEQQKQNAELQKQNEQAKAGEAVANAVQAITLNVLDKDYTLQICVSYYQQVEDDAVAAARITAEAKTDEQKGRAMIAKAAADARQDARAGKTPATTSLAAFCKGALKNYTAYWDGIIKAAADRDSVLKVLTQYFQASCVTAPPPPQNEGAQQRCATLALALTGAGTTNGSAMPGTPNVGTSGNPTISTPPRPGGLPSPLGIPIN